MRTSRCALTVIAALAGMLGCTGGEISQTGRLVIIGGRLQDDNTSVYEAILEGRRGDGPLCILPTASADPAASMESARETLASYAGMEGVAGVPLSTEDPSLAEDPAIAADLATCSGFYFTGGSQSRVVDVFLPEGDTTAAYRALWKRWQEGAVVAGSSAGAAMMSRIMIAGGTSSEAVANGVASGGGDGVRIRGGMGFFDRAIVDQHFLARGRIGRLLVAALATDSLPLGVGIDENTALVVDGDTAFVVGASGVVLVDGREAQRTGAHYGSGLRVTLAGAGDVIDLTTFEVRPAETKAALPSTVEPLKPPDDPFARWAFLHLMVDLAASPDREAAISLEGAALRVAEAEGFSAVMLEEDGGPDGTPSGISAGPFTVDLLPQ